MPTLDCSHLVWPRLSRYAIVLTSDPFNLSTLLLVLSQIIWPITGDQRRVEIARALATEPELLLLDEPTAGMNAAETHIVGKLILKLRDEGLTILVIEHDMELISQVCNEVVALNFGQLIAHGTPAEIKANSAVIEAYLGEEEEQIIEHRR